MTSRTNLVTSLCQATKEFIAVLQKYEGETALSTALTIELNNLENGKDPIGIAKQILLQERELTNFYVRHRDALPFKEFRRLLAELNGACANIIVPNPEFPPVAKLRHTLQETTKLLLKFEGESNTSAALNGCLNQLENGKDPQDVARAIIRSYAGMGSFNEYYIENIAAQAEFSILKDRLYAACANVITQNAKGDFFTEN